MKVRITWIDRNIVQIKELVKCRTKQGQFTINSPIYEAIEDGSFCLNLLHSKHHFKIEEI